MFVALGATASAAGALLRQWSHALSIVAGLGIIVMGAHFLGLFRISAMLREARLEVAKPPGLWSAYLMGVAFAFGWTPCIGPILAAILAVAGAQETVGQGALLLVVYALGLGAPFVVAAIAMERFLAFSRGFRRQFARLEKATGALLVVTGVLFLTGGMQSAAAWLIETFPSSDNWGERRAQRSTPRRRKKRSPPGRGGLRCLEPNPERAGRDHIWWKLILPSACFFQTYQT